MSDLEQPPLTRAEVDRRLPTLELIDDYDIRKAVREMSRFAPAYFWKRPGSTSGYHNAHEHGLWAHTLKLSTVIERLADSWVERELIRPTDVDRAHAAAIVHDQLKEGNPPTDGTASDHDLQMAAIIRADTTLDDTVARAVAAHMGPWYEGPEPTVGSLEDLVHVADMVASTDTIPVPVADPVPAELTEHVAGVEL